MRKTASTSSSPTTDGQRLLLVPLNRLRAHPANPNRMDEVQLAKLAENVVREGSYPPLVVRPHPQEAGCYELLDGHQRWEVLRRLGHKKANCFLWPCNDRTALVLLATLNRLQGQDDPFKRAELLRDLAALAPPEELALLLPEDAGAIRQSLELLNIDLESLLAEFQAEPGSASGLRALTFAVTAEDEAVIEEAVESVAADLQGANRRGRALAIIAKREVNREDRR